MITPENKEPWAEKVAQGFLMETLPITDVIRKEITDETRKVQDLAPKAYQTLVTLLCAAYDRGNEYSKYTGPVAVYQTPELDFVFTYGKAVPDGLRLEVSSIVIRIGTMLEVAQVLKTPDPLHPEIKVVGLEHIHSPRWNDLEHYIFHMTRKTMIKLVSGRLIRTMPSMKNIINHRSLGKGHMIALPNNTPESATETLLLTQQLSELINEMTETLLVLPRP